MRSASMVVLLSSAIAGAPTSAQEWDGRARVDGRVTDASGAPIAGATVTARHLVLQTGPRVTTDTGGHFALDGIAAGSWTVEVAAPGHLARRIGLHLPGESSWLDLVEVRLDEVRPGPRPSPGHRGDVDGPGDPTGYEDVRAALDEGRVDRARRLLPVVGASDPGDATLLSEIGLGLLAAGETEAALAVFDRALERDPGHVDARYGRALGRLALGYPEGARADLVVVRELRPGSVLAEKAGLALERLPPASPGE